MRTNCQYRLVNVSSHLENLSLSRVKCHQRRALFYNEQIPVYHLQNIKTKGEQPRYPEDTGKLPGNSIKNYTLRSISEVVLYPRQHGASNSIME